MAPKDLTNPHDDPSENLSSEEIVKVTEIVRDATNAVVPVQTFQLKGKWLRLEIFAVKHKRKPIWLALTFILISLTLYFVQPYIGLRALLIAKVVALPFEFAAIGILVCHMLLIVPTLAKTRADPLYFILNLIELTAMSDLRFLNELNKCSPRAVQYVAKQYQYHRTIIERRNAALAGNIGSPGLLPAIAALTLLLHAHSQSSTTVWPLYLAFIILVFHALNLYSFGLQQRMDRVIAILEASIAMQLRGQVQIRRKLNTSKALRMRPRRILDLGVTPSRRIVAGAPVGLRARGRG